MALVELVGLRLARATETPPRYTVAPAADFWAAVHRRRLTVCVRWLVLPATVVGAPGHAEFFILAADPRGGDSSMLQNELAALLGLSYPSYEFEPLEAAELAYALVPFDQASWTLVLEPANRAGPAPIGFLDGKAAQSQAAAEPLAIDLKRSDASQRLYLLSTLPSISVLDWLMVPLDLDVPQRERFAHRMRVEFEPGAPPRSFACTARWTSAAGATPALIGNSVLETLGLGTSRFSEADRARVGTDLGPLLETAECEMAAWQKTLHCAVPSLLPPPCGIEAAAPALVDRVRSRLPLVELPDSGTQFGFTPDQRPVRLPLADRMRHVWIIGQTGTGKSTLLLNCILQDIHDGNGVAVFDPHGELVSGICRSMPPHRLHDLVVVNASDPQQEQPHLNILESANVHTAHMRAGQVVELMVALWGAEFCGPMWQQAAMSGLLVLAARFEEPGTICDLPRLFLDEKFRRKWLDDALVQKRVPSAVAWWRDSWGAMTGQQRTEMLDYFISKFSLFFNDPILGAILGHSRSSIDLRRIMDERKVLLCNLSRGGANPMATTMLTCVFMQAALNAALERVQTPSSSRVPFFIYCDEFQRVAGPSTAAILSEVRKYNVGLTLAHQFVDQLPAETLSAVLGNVGTKLLFRVGARDAARLQSYQPDLGISELVYLPNFVAIAETLVNGVPSQPFTLHALPPPSTANTLAHGGLRVRGHVLS